MDDGTLGGPKDVVTTDLHRLIPTLQDLDLPLNEQKCKEIHLDDPYNTKAKDAKLIEGSDTDRFVRLSLCSVDDTLANSVEDSDPHADDPLHTAQRIPLTCISILGFLINVRGSDEVLGKIEEVDRHANIGLFFFSRYAAVLRATYLLSSAPFHAGSESLRVIDELIWHALFQSCNLQLDNRSLPLQFGGLGVRRLADVALPVCIATLEASQNLIYTINPRPRPNQT